MKSIKKHKKKSHKRKQRFRDLSKGNDVIYKGTKGFHLIKKYRNKRRHESRQYRQLSLGAMGMRLIHFCFKLLTE